MGVDAAARTVLERCDALAGFSEEPDRLTRRYGTPALAAAGEAVADWMRAAGLTTRRDAIGNLIGRREGAGGTLILGSHLDTVRNAGRYDGMLGVLVALACAERVGSLPYALEIAAFADEEGVRYGTGYLGSAAFADRFDPEWLGRTDADGIALADAVREFGGDPDALPSAPADILGYCEVHIEQGPVLEQEDLPVGVVSGIAGQTRARVAFAGTAGHAGTVPMELRRDALCAAAELVLVIESVGRRTEGLVATVGEAAVEPGAGNVIPGRAVLSVDVRHGSDDVRRAACAALEAGAREIAGARAVELSWETLQDTAAVACSPALTEPLAEAVADAGHRVVRLLSGAGHDAVTMAALGPIAMLFVRCAGGVSHNPAESVELADVAAAIDVMSRFLERVPCTT